MIFKKIFKGLAILTIFLLVLGFLLFAPIDRTALHDESFYSDMLGRLDTTSFSNSVKNKVLASWGKVNITPSYSMPMAGYKPRDHFEAIHDSLFARVITFKTNNGLDAVINVDLLLFPPALKARLMEKLSQFKTQTFLYLSATHTHNGLGGWNDSLLGKLALGKFHEEWIEQTSEKIYKSIVAQNQIGSSIQYWESDASEYVVNRIAYDKGEKDGKIRGFRITREDSTKACLFSYSAHATSISKKILSLSADYPSEVIKGLEKEFDFGMYMGGMVGSHSFKNFEKQNFELIEEEGSILIEKISQRKQYNSFDSISISTAHVPIEFGPSQLRISDNWKARNWVLSALFGGLRGELTYLRLGDIVMIATPCDFSGEISVRDSLDYYAAQLGEHLIITSFNGNYAGYITYDGHYDSIKNAETRELNWVGPYYGEYFSTMIKKLITKE